jgi:hypothetical protein
MRLILREHILGKICFSNEKEQKVYIHLKQHLKEMATSLGYVLKLPLTQKNCSIRIMRILMANPRDKSFMLSFFH